MAWVVLALELVFAVAGFGVRTLVQWRRTGDTGWRLRSETTAAAAFGRVALALVVVLAVASPLADLAGLGRWSPLDRAEVAAGGVVLLGAGSALTVWAQFVMGASWRIGVDTAERTALVTGGPFRSVRNPIYTAMVLALAGVTLALPNPISLAAVLVAVLAVEVQVRRVEEPYLLASHPGEYAGYAARTGRFVPGLGRTG